MVPGMIDKGYFKRQARTLRKMVKATQDTVVAERLSEMADDFDARAEESPIASDRRFSTLRRGLQRDEGPD